MTTDPRCHVCGVPHADHWRKDSQGVYPLCPICADAFDRRMRTWTNAGRMIGLAAFAAMVVYLMLS